MESEDEYGIVFYTDQIPRLLREHGLTSVQGLTMPWEKLPGASPAEKLEALLDE